MVGFPGWSKPDVWRKPAVYALVTAAHLVLFIMVGTRQPVVPVGITPPIDLVLFRPAAPPPPPQPEPEPAGELGGGAPAAPSRVRPAARPAGEPPEVIARPVPAPEPAMALGVSPEPGPVLAQGQDGEGTGMGGGVGAGAGPGTGTTRARLLRAASTPDLRHLHPPSARGRSGRAVVTCRMRLDTRLDACRVGSETPPGLGFAAAGLAAAEFYRFQPPTEGGRPVEGEITIIVEFGRPAR